MTLREAYREAMNHVTVTSEMRARILNNIQSADIRTTRVRFFSRSARYLAAAACLALLIAGSIVLPNFIAPAQNGDQSGVQNGTLDRTEAASLHELSQLVGFEVGALENRLLLSHKRSIRPMARNWRK